LNLELKTPRLLLRPWRPEDRDPFAEMSADPAVMEYFPSLLSRAESDASADRAEAAFAQRGFGFWAVEIPGEASFAGFIGLTVPWFEAHFTPCVEIGWRLAHRFWGKGYATEGARAALDFGFERLGLQEIVSYAVAANTRSIRVMEKIGMKFSGEFDHPQLEPGHRLRRHALYRLRMRRAPILE
jgi:RimJ/RimL family protein N-acetyltransferase